jgi:hypothetical protein
MCDLPSYGAVFVLTRNGQERRHLCLILSMEHHDRGLNHLTNGQQCPQRDIDHCPFGHIETGQEQLYKFSYQ